MTPEKDSSLSPDVINQIRNRMSEFELKLFNAALDNLSDSTNPLRFNNFAYAMREVTRHILQRLAPEDEVKKCSWYKRETDNPPYISRQQRMIYAIQGGLSNNYIEDVLGLDITDIRSRLRDSIDQLSKFTHIEQGTFNLPAESVEAAVKDTLLAIAEFFETIDACRKEVVEGLQERIDDEVVDQALSETIDSIDELATHHFIDEVYTADVTVLSIDSEFIHFQAEGTISCELQWGSNSDARRGDAVIIPQQFPFLCELKSDVNNPDDFDPDLATLRVDTSSWRDNYTDEK